MTSTYVCIFCQKNMKMIDSWGIGLCEGCDVSRDHDTYRKRVTYKSRPYDLTWNMRDQEFILEDPWSDFEETIVFKSHFDINITPQNALKKLPTLLVFL